MKKSIFFLMALTSCLMMVSCATQKPMQKKDTKPSKCDPCEPDPCDKGEACPYKK